MIKRIGNHIRNGLRFSCAGRPMQNKAIPLGSFNHSHELAGIYAAGNCQISHLISVIQFFYIRFILVIVSKSSLYKRFNDFIFCQFIKSQIQVIPHNELAKREISDKGHFNNIPARQIHYSFTNKIEHKRQVCAALVRR